MMLSSMLNSCTYMYIPSAVANINRDGSYALHYNDGDRDEFAPERNIKAPEKVRAMLILMMFQL